MNILMLMAGSSQAFFEAGYVWPKMLIEVSGKPLVEHILHAHKSLECPGNRFLCMVRKEENRAHHLGTVIQLLMPEAKILEIDQQTAGAACSALLAIEDINTDAPLLILNGDQLIRANLQQAIADFTARNLDGGIITFRAVHPRWSYVRTDAAGLVIEAAEKRPISNQATAGAYWFRRGSDFVAAAMAMICKDAQVEGSFYVCPVYNEMVLMQKRIGTFEIAAHDYISVTTPQALRALERNPSAAGLYEAA
jgi:NDP-sugar pyrophosphorylase family protein